MAGQKILRPGLRARFRRMSKGLYRGTAPATTEGHAGVCGTIQEVLAGDKDSLTYGPMADAISAFEDIMVWV